MRPDMKKVIVSRGKKSGNRNYNRAGSINENGPIRESMQSQYHYDGKESKNFSAPLIRFLKSNLGRPWDKVYSDICKNNKDELGHVLRERIDYTVELHCQFIDGELMTKSGHQLYREFYVHPTTGILCYKEGEKRYRREPNKSKIVELDGLEYFKHQDVWYRVKSAIYQPVQFNHYQNHVIDEFGTERNNLMKTYGSSRYIIWKQQANSDECKQLNALIEKE